MKGSKKCKGLMNIGHNVGTMIQVEFPKLIVNMLTTCMGVESHACLQQEEIVLDTTSNIYTDLALYYNSITESIDTRTNESGANREKEEYLINTENFVGKFVDNDRVATYYNALNGVTNETYTSRQEYFECVSSLCLVSSTTVNNKAVYIGSCVQYCKTRYCNHSGYYQYKNKLESSAVQIPTHRTSHGGRRRRYDRKETAKTKLKNRLTSITIRLDALKTICFKKACLYHSITKEISMLPCVTSILIALVDANNHYCSERLESANECELVTTNLNDRLRKWKGNDQEQQEVQNIVKQIKKIHSLLSNIS